MHSLGINGEGELRGNRLTQVHLKKMAVKTECVSVCGVNVANVNKISSTISEI